MFPIDLGFKMPPEWVRHSCTLMEWPVKEALWPEPFTEILPAYAEIVKRIADFEPVILLANPHSKEEAQSYCGPKVKVLAIAHDDSWTRDNGPTLLINRSSERLGINWIFNGWGNKYPSEKDNQVASIILNHWRIPKIDAPLVMEGGSFHVDGEGALLTTEECLLHPNRNPNLTKATIELYLQNYLGVTKIIWLKRGWLGDDTDGHVDNVACFAKPGVILTQVCSDPQDPNTEITQENLAILNQATDAQGRPLKIIEIEQPKAAYYGEARLTLSYLNFYFVNGGIILPVFGGENHIADENAIRIFRQVFPERKIATVNGSIVARGGGNVHCLTQQVPEGTE